MKWNWQQETWPHFVFDVGANANAEQRFLLRAGTMLGAFAGLNEADQNSLRVHLLSNEAIETSRIEGEVLDRASVQSSIQRHFGLQADRSGIPLREQGVAEIMVDLYRQFGQPLTEKRLLEWHHLLLQASPGVVSGAYRQGAEPMRVVSGGIEAYTVHFEAPPSDRVAAEMKRFVEWFEASRSKLPALVRASLAHLYFESIHPFEDGNGRMGRALVDLALSQSLGQPLLLSLSQVIERDRKLYYHALAAASRGLEADDWIALFSDMILRAQEESLVACAWLIAKTRFMDRFAEQVNERQHKVLLRLFREGPAGFEGGLSASNYHRITKAPPATTTRDLADLVDKGALIRTGQRRHTRYFLNPAWIPPGLNLA